MGEKTKEKSLLRKKRKFLKNFMNLKKKEQISKIRTCSNFDIHTICECFYNLLAGRLCLDSKSKQKIKKLLDPIKKETRKLASPNIDINKKRKILLKPQVGRGIISGLATVVGIVLPAILSAIRK